ncbi:hydroxyacylglutathione hydrolase [Psychromonas sp. KJ10-2]|uniref:hydroxyacylglutathione hydrolase n=1 Tax=Psychromonas sp. KJ10-2 TaxID=3391822 RepID=UPI0039B47690
MFTVLTIPAFDDNYIWLVKDSQSQRCVVVDPGDATPVLEILSAQSLTIEAILLTHHHHDHTGGVNELIADNPEIKIFSKEALFAGATLVKENDQVSLLDGRLTLNVWEVAGHTLDHIVFYNDQLLFCGDTLFSGGCGRVFEGKKEQMYQAVSRLRGLDDNIQVYCAHEYTQNNLIFALAVDPNNQDLIAYIKQVSKLRQQGVPTIPTSIAQEKRINPFFRYDDPDLLANVQAILAEPITAGEGLFKALRTHKDHF